MEEKSRASERTTGGNVVEIEIRWIEGERGRGGRDSEERFNRGGIGVVKKWFGGMFVMRGWQTLPGCDKRVIARFARERTPPNSQIRGRPSFSK